LVDEAKRLLDRKRSAYGDIFSGPGWVPDVEWMLTEAFVSTEPAEVFKPAEDSVGEAPAAETEQWLPQLIGEAANWPEPGTRKPYWSARTAGHTSSAWMGFARLSGASSN
jgi:hypothetical protein